MTIHISLLFAAVAILPSYIPGLSIVDTALVRATIIGSFAFWMWLNRRSEVPTIYEFPKRIQACPFLCLASAGDEPFGWLETVDVLVNLPFLLLHRAILVATVFLIGILHYMRGWPFGRAVIWLWAYAFLIVRPTDDGLIPRIWHLVTIRGKVADDWVEWITSSLWNGTFGMGGLYVTLAASTIEYFLLSWMVLAVLALAASFVVRAIALGAPVSPMALLESFLVRSRIMLTPIWFADVELRFVSGTVSKWLIHSEVYDDEDAIEAAADWIERRLEQSARNTQNQDRPLRRSSPRKRKAPTELF